MREENLSTVDMDMRGKINNRVLHSIFSMVVPQGRGKSKSDVLMLETFAISSTLRFNEVVNAIKFM